MADKTIRCGIVGYGPVFNFGRAHAGWIGATSGLELVAVCDRDPDRAALARGENPGIRTYTSLDEMLAQDDIDLVSVVVPHHLHREVVVACLRAGKHTVVDKPMAVTVAECDAMIEAAEQAGRTLAVFHNRRHDGNYRAIRRVVESGRIGDVFRVEVNAGGYGSPGSGWRSRKEVSGGALYDWGSHAIDWVLNLVASPPVRVTGFAQKRVWMDATNEDHTQAILRFENGCVAELQISSLAAAPKPRWRILGTQGGILDEGKEPFSIYVRHEGYPARIEARYEKTDWQAYYNNIAAHLKEGAELDVKPEQARRIIAVLQAAQRSAASGQAEKPAYP